MSNQALLSDIVSLYRKSTKSSLNEDCANCKITLNSELISSINSIFKRKDGVIENLKCNDSAVYLPLDIKNNGTVLQFRLIFPVIKFRRFFNNLEDLISHQTGIKKGKIPDAFYLIEEDYLNSEANEPEKYQQLQQVCRWILFLKKALPHTEEKSDAYVFVLLTEDKANKGFKKHLIESRFDYKDLRNLDGLEKFEEILTSNDLHSSERLAVVRNALEELFAKHPSENQHLNYTLSQFEVLKQLYQDNYETYINGFSLRDFKKEVIEKHSGLASLIESNLNDVVNKAFIIPVSIASTGALIKTNELINSTIVSFSVFLVSIFMWRLTQQHLGRLKSIDAILDESFEQFKDRKENAAQFVNEKRQHLTERASSIRKDLKFFLWLSTTPFLSAVILLFFKYPQISDGFKQFIFLILCLQG